MHLHQPPSTFNHLGEKARRKDAKIIKNLYTKHYKVSHQVLKLITVVVGGWGVGGWGMILSVIHIGKKSRISIVRTGTVKDS